MSKIEYFNEDCMVGMARYPDKYFDLAIVDPPYGIGKDWKKRNKGRAFAETSYKNQTIPGQEYFSALFRISNDVIVWGYNYYTDFLGTTNYLIVWDKVSNKNQVFHYSKAEIAYTTKKIPCNLVSIPWDGYRMGKETGNKKIHPHQKPIALYKWLLKNYAKPNDKILDTHVGSASSLIACYDMGFDAVGFEFDKEYFDMSMKRLEDFKRQPKIDEILLNEYIQGEF
jgi:site-specific DNA-methyltransferase (adenine-specific)